MVTIIMIVTYIWKFFAIKHRLVHILAKFWDFIAYTKRLSTLQNFGHSKFKQILTTILQYFSLYITLRSFCWVSIYMYYTGTYIHTLKAKRRMMIFALCSQKLSDEKNGYFGGRGNLE